MNIHNVDIEFNEGKPHKLKYNNKFYKIISYERNEEILKRFDLKKSDFPDIDNIVEDSEKVIEIYLKIEDREDRHKINIITKHKYYVLQYSNSDIMSDKNFVIVFKKHD